MPARLSSLLVRDGLVGVKRMEKAFQRQVIYGGSLDTILLEMALVTEERLTQYLALASGLPPAARDEAESIEPKALALISPEIAAQFRAVPLTFDGEGEALRVLVCSPLEINELEDLADLLDRPLQPLITPECRWHIAYSRAYHVDAPARFTTLARTLAGDATPEPIGRSRSVIVDDADATRPMVAPPVVAAQPASPIAPVARAEDRTDKVVVDLPLETKRNASATLVGIEPPARRARPHTDPGIPIPRLPAGQRGSLDPITTTGRDSPLAIVRARELLATADDRDTVFLTLLRATRARARYAGLLTVQGGAAIGRVALAEIGIDIAAITKVLIPLDAMSPFRSVVQNQQPHIGPLASGDDAIDGMAMRFGGTLPPSAMLMPIVLRDRVVAIVVAHRVHSDLRLADVTELLPLASAAADALGRLIVKHKSAGYRAPTENSGAVQIEAERIETKKITKADAQWRAPAPAERPSVPNLDGPELHMTAALPITEVLDEIEGSREGEAEDALNDAVERAHETLGELAKRFPGKLRVDRFAVAGRPLRAMQYGGLLELVVRLGSAAGELLIEHMKSPHRDTRFYATVCASELRPRNAIFVLVERLFDQDFGVRDVALEALSGYPLAELTQALAKARRSLHSDDPETVAAAATAVVQLGDVEAVADLIGALERNDRGAEHARKALIALTSQDFGLSERKWRKWFDGARKRHRVEWLIEGLSHKEDAIREASINDLRRLTGEYFGYHHDLPRREREVAAERWVGWWQETGMRRFVEREDERHRPTGVLPARKEP
jgi:HEAT repeat protein